MTTQQPIVAPVNLTGRCEEGVRWALQYGKETKTDVVALLVVERIAFDIFARKSSAALLSAAQRALDQFAFERGWHGLLTTAGVDGWVADSIVRYAHEHRASLIALQGHRHPAVRHMFLSSLSEDVARQASCPVAIVRPGLGVDWRDSGSTQFASCTSWPTSSRSRCERPLP